MKEDVKEDNGLYNRFFNESSAAMIVLNSEGKILTANKRFRNFTASVFGAEENNDLFSGKEAVSVEDILNPWQNSIFWSSILPITKGEKNYVVFEFPFLFIKDKEKIQRWFNIHAWRIEGIPPASQDILIGLNLEDNTLVRQEENRLLHDKDLAEKALEAKGQFLSSMSHEIRTPIQTIIGMLELLQDTHLDNEQIEYSRQVKFSAEVLLSLVNDLLDYSKIEAGKMELEHIDFDLEQTVEQAVDMIALEAHKKGLTLATSIPLQTNIIIKGDPGKFRQIVINLVKNAVKFTQEGSVTFSTTFTRVNEQEAIRVSVAERGIGVSEEARSHIFSAYVQADVSDTRRFGGTGLGLAISQNLVQLMKGHIEMVPNEGGGSIFRFDIPLERSSEMPDPLPPPERDGKLKILIVDSRAEGRSITDSCLRELGYTNISQAKSGKSALKMIRAATENGNAYRICFIDMVMPVMDGWRLAAEIHNDSSIKQPDLILTVPHGLLGADTKMALLKWFKAYINKPIKRRRVADTISAVLNEPQELELASDLEELEDHINDIPILRDNVDEEALLSEKNGENKPLILIAEDHPVNQKLFSMIMDKLGFPSLLAVDGLDALEKAQAHNVSLLFMDIQMPRMNGYEATETLRRLGFKKPIIAVTAGNQPEERKRCFSAGVDDILVKPFQRSDLEEMLFKWINVRQDAAQAEQKTVETPSASVFDAATLLDTFLNNEQTVLSLLARFIERTKNQIDALPELEKAGNWETASREAHTIKGAALTMSGTELGKAAGRLELAYNNIDKGEMEAAMPPLQEAFDRFKKAAEEFSRSRK